MRQSYQPTVLVDTTNLSRDDWLAYRRYGIGGSDAAAILVAEHPKEFLCVTEQKRKLFPRGRNLRG